MGLNGFGPFHFEVWGSFADWIMIGVTGYTLYCLRETLKSQKIVQNDQTKLMNIENEKFKILSKPKITLEHSIPAVHEVNECIKVDMNLRFKLTKNDCRKISVQCITEDEKNVIFKLFKKEGTQYFFEGEVVNAFYSYELPYQSYDERPSEHFQGHVPTIPVTEIVLKFEDVIGNKYTEKFITSYPDFEIIPFENLKDEI